MAFAYKKTHVFSSSKVNSGLKGAIKDIERDADVIFAVIDKDGSDSITREELTQHLTSAAYTKDVINKIFTKMDTNKDNLISRQEFREGFKLFSALQSAPGLGNYNAEFVKEIYQDADQVFQSADANNDGGEFHDKEYQIQIKFLHQTYLTLSFKLFNY